MAYADALSSFFYPLFLSSSLCSFVYFVPLCLGLAVELHSTQRHREHKVAPRGGQRIGDGERRCSILHLLSSVSFLFFVFLRVLRALCLGVASDDHPAEMPSD